MFRLNDIMNTISKVSTYVYDRSPRSGPIVKLNGEAAGNALLWKRSISPVRNDKLALVGP